MKLQEIYDFLDNLSPFESQEKWDNSGLITGDLKSDTNNVILSLDIDEKLIADAKTGSTFIVHHPLIFTGIKSINLNSYPSNLLVQIIKKDINLIAMHTNFDKSHLNSYVFSKVLGFNLDKQNDFICSTYEKFSTKALLKLLREKLKIQNLRVVNYKDEVKGLSLTTGAGASLMESVDTECFLTGDIKYHDAMQAISEKRVLIDIGHFESEQFFVDVMSNLLNSLPISVIIAQSKNPFETFSLHS